MCACGVCAHCTCVNMCAGRFVVPFELAYAYQVSLAKILQDAGNASCVCAYACAHAYVEEDLGVSRVRLYLFENVTRVYMFQRSRELHVSMAVDSIWLCV